MSGATAGARLGKTKEDGQKLLDNFFTGFSGVKVAIDQSKAFLKENGYVEDFIGRRRRLTDINLQPYEAKLKDTTGQAALFNPIYFCKNKERNIDAVVFWTRIIDSYVILSNIYQMYAARNGDKAFTTNNEMSSSTFDKLKKIAANPKLLDTAAWYDLKPAGTYNASCRTHILDDYNNVLRLAIAKKLYQPKGKRGQPKPDLWPIPENELLNTLMANFVEKWGLSDISAFPSEPVQLFAWTGRIAQASRQCFNARIQGSAASLTKMAMIDIFNDEELKKYDAHLVITVHDEVLVECPAVYADAVEKRLPEIMINAAKKGGDDVPQSCDPYNVTRWYSDTMAATVLDEYKKAEKAGLTNEEAFEKVCNEHVEIPRYALEDAIYNNADELIF